MADTKRRETAAVEAIGSKDFSIMLVLRIKARVELYSISIYIKLYFGNKNLLDII